MNTPREEMSNVRLQIEAMTDDTRVKYLLGKVEDLATERWEMAVKFSYFRDGVICATVTRRKDT
jgi:hypothetical protein